MIDSPSVTNTSSSSSLGAISSVVPVVAAHFSEKDNGIKFASEKSELFMDLDRFIRSGTVTMLLAAVEKEAALLNVVEPRTTRAPSHELP